MGNIQHLIFASAQPKIFRLKNKPNPDDFRLHYALDAATVQRILNSIFKLYPSVSSVSVIIDIELAELNMLLGFINQKREEIFHISQIFSLNSFLFVPFVDILNPVKTTRLLNQSLEWGKLNVRQIFSGTIDFKKLK